MSRTAPSPAVKKDVKKAVKKTVKETATAISPKAKTLAQAKVDFTSEGSPPPGTVSAGLPPAKPDV